MKRVITVEKIENYNLDTPLIYFVRVNGSPQSCFYEEDKAIEYAEKLSEVPEKITTEIFIREV